LSQKQWAKPEAVWAPLNQAVFRFGIVEDGAAADLCNEQLLEMTGAEIAALGPIFLSLAQLTNTLKDTSGASYAEIDTSTSTFSLLFPDGGSRNIKGSPWELLKNIPAVIISEDTAGSYTAYAPGYKENAMRLNKVRAAISLVWCKLMLPAFNCAISRGAVALYARPHIASVHFQRLPKYVWSLLSVVDWDNGVAMAVDHTAFWSIYAERVTTTAAARESDVVDARLSETVAHSDLKEAPRAAIHEAIKAAYDSAQAAGGKPPNILELPAAVLPLLEAKGCRTSVRLIRQLGTEYAHRRRRRGARAT
jgi:hypothetical protein